MGADCIVTGVSPAIAQAIVHLGVDLSGVMTRSTMAEGLKLALKMTGQKLEGVSTGQSVNLPVIGH